MTDAQRFRRWTRELRKLFPSLYPVRVCLVAPQTLPQALGLCTPYERDGRPIRFRIDVANNLSTQQTADTLAEEWAHVLRFHIYHLPAGNGGHDAIYGAIFNEIKAKWLHGEEEA